MPAREYPQENTSGGFRALDSLLESAERPGHSADLSSPKGGDSDKFTQYEFIDSKELALRWNLPESWVREQVRSRSTDPIPHIRFGKYVRFRWESPELEGWAERRIVSTSNRIVGRALGKESK